MADVVINIHAAKTSLSKLVARAEKGERIVIARHGKPARAARPNIESEIAQNCRGRPAA